MTIYILNEIKGNAAGIAAESNIKASENAAPMEYSGARISYGDLKGISKSNLTVDIRTGLLMESKSKTRIAGNLNVSAPGTELQIPMEINSESMVVAQPWGRNSIAAQHRELKSKSETQYNEKSYYPVLPVVF